MVGKTQARGWALVAGALVVAMGVVGPAQALDCRATPKAAACKPGAKGAGDRAGVVPGLKGAGTPDNPLQVGASQRDLALKLGDGRPEELTFAFSADKPGKVRFILTGYTSPIDVSWSRRDGSGAESANFIKAPDQPSYARFSVEPGDYLYHLRLVGPPTSVTLRTVSDESCPSVNNQFMRIPIGGSCEQ